MRNLPAGMVMYDGDLRIVMAEGELLRSAGYRPELMRGRLLSDIVPTEVFSLLETRYRQALSGVEQDLDYSSPVGGYLYRTRGRMVRDDTGAVVAAVLLIWDITALAELQDQVDGARTLIGFGSAVFHRESGWSIEASLLALWGVAADATPEHVIVDLVVDEDRIRVQQAWTEARRTGALVSVEYAIRHGRTGELRHLHGAVRATTGRDGALLSAQTTQVDVTDFVRARQRAQAAERRAGQRDLLSRQVSTLLSNSPESYEHTLQATAELAATAIGDGCVLRSFNDDGTAQVLTVAHCTPEGRAQLDAWMRTLPPQLARAGAAVRQVSTSRVPVRGVVEQGDPANPPWSWGNRYVIAPALHLGQVRGTVGLFRAADGPDYDDDDVDLLRALADRFGSLMEAERAGAEARQLTAELMQINGDQRELVLQLDRTESRERGRLADAVHDEPLQLAVAALLRLDSYRAQLPEGDAGGDAIDDIAALLEPCVSQLRTLVGTLTPPDLSRGLGVALRRLAEGVFVGTEVRVDVRGPDHVHLDPTTKETIYRIMREALVNARKHAHATAVQLDLVEHDDTVVLRLTDNGVGIPTQARPATPKGISGISGWCRCGPGRPRRTRL